MSDTAYYFSEFGPSDDERTAQAPAAEAAAGYPQDWPGVVKLVEAAKLAYAEMKREQEKEKYCPGCGMSRWEVTIMHTGETFNRQRHKPDCPRQAALAALAEAGIK